MKKVIVSILLIIIMFNLISPIISYATEVNDTINASEEYNQLMNSDTRTITSNGEKREEKVGVGPIWGGTTANVLSNIITSILFTVTSALSSLAKNSPTDAYSFTVYDAVFNEVPAFDANYLTSSDNTNNIHLKIKEQVEIWYGAIRRIAIVLSLCVLIYVGIRMAISTVAEDEAKYKKMLIGWLQSFILIFFMHYIILFSTIVSKALLDLIKLIPVSKSAEIKIFWIAFLDLIGIAGWDALATSIVYWFLAFYQIKFFFLYAKRMLSVAFLIIISPLITVITPIGNTTYVVSGQKEDKPQLFNNWFKEFEVNMFIQPLHALLYALFFMSASEIILRAPILAAIFFMGLSRGEKVIKGIFDARGMKSIHSMGKGKKKK